MQNKDHFEIKSQEKGAELITAPMQIDSDELETVSGAPIVENIPPD